MKGKRREEEMQAEFQRLQRALAEKEKVLKHLLCLQKQSITGYNKEQQITGYNKEQQEQKPTISLTISNNKKETLIWWPKWIPLQFSLRVFDSFNLIPTISDGQTLFQKSVQLTKYTVFVNVNQLNK